MISLFNDRDCLEQFVARNLKVFTYFSINTRRCKYLKPKLQDLLSYFHILDKHMFPVGEYFFPRVILH